MPISDFAFALLLTIAVECLTVFAIGYRRKYQIIVVILVNVITNPALNYVLMLLRMLGMYWYLHLVMLEIAAVLVEWRIMTYAFKTESKKLLILSAAMNGASYAAGILTVGI